MVIYVKKATAFFLVTATATLAVLATAMSAVPVTATLAVPATATSAGRPFKIDGPCETDGDFPVFVTEELAWDNGERSYSLCWYEGRYNWLAVDFDATEISATPYIASIRVYSRDDWPNDGYDGFYFALYSFVDDKPGSIVWPADGDEALFVQPTGLPHGDTWVDIQVGWTCDDPRFVAAVNQYYDEPDCDPLALDTNEVPSGHSWMYVNNAWKPFDSSSLNVDNENIMIRAEVQDTGTEHTITPASIGAIKAIYR